MKRTGFTLIELLVVIAIIAILAAILFPVFARARAKAFQNTCLSNVKQLTLGVLMYVNDYDERFMPALAGWAYGPTWKGDIYPYVKNPDLFRCPSYFPVSYSGRSNDTVPGSNPAQPFAISYATVATGNLCGTPVSGYAPQYTHYMGEIAKPAETIVICESTSDWSPYLDNAYPVTAPQIVANHNRQSNYGFCDGHAKSMMPTATNLTQNMWTIQDDGPAVSGCNLPGWLSGTEQYYP
jgi:prepilin-type N-terminal cleavage/methylation domain-containing protein/prepilin-type processing-associated H-X9-DG protein